MSGHFVYEIDERKLRVRLQEIEVELKQDSWSNFEAYYLANTENRNEKSFQNFNVPISMNVLLPVLFGAIIVVIAIVLFKFISIKNPPANPNENVIQQTNTQLKVDSTLIKQKIARNAFVADSLANVEKMNAILNAEKIRKADSINALTKATPSVNVSAIQPPTPLTNKEVKTESNNLNNKATTDTQNKTENKEITKPKKKKPRKASSDTSAQAKAAEELIQNTPDENEPTLKPH